ncbi:MAG: response regulator [Clostridiales bacterium]|nr:response regulator [Clostridiales bacterium]
MRKVMLVEDEAVIRSGLKKLLEQVIGGFCVCAEAGDGAEALRLLPRAQPDVVITDLKMDGVSGLELIEKLHLLDANLPVIIISGYSDFQYAQTAIRHGAKAYLLKPVDRVELMQALSRACPAPAAEDDPDGNLIVQRAKVIIKSRLSEEISLRSIAEEIGMNHQYLSAFFKKHTGKNFSRYIAEKRIALAQKHLKDSRLRVYEVAELSGYHSLKHFTGVFKEIAGCTPTEYRDMVMGTKSGPQEP